MGQLQPGRSSLQRLQRWMASFIISVSALSSASVGCGDAFLHVGPSDWSPGEDEGNTSGGLAPVLVAPQSASVKPTR
jgi:hypothetical protein